MLPSASISNRSPALSIAVAVRFVGVWSVTLADATTVPGEAFSVTVPPVKLRPRCPVHISDIDGVCLFDCRASASVTRTTITCEAPVS